MPPTDAFDPADRRRAAEPDTRRDRRSGRGWLRPRLYRALRAVHIAVGVGWLGTVVGKLVLELGVLAAASPRRAEGLFTAAAMISKVFPPLVLATLLTGALLGLGTRWGLLRYYWVVTKLALTLTVVVTAVSLVERLARLALPAPVDGLDAVTGVLASPARLLASLTGGYVAILLTATVVSVYKPWGRIAARRGAL